MTIGPSGNGGSKMAYVHIEKIGADRNRTKHVGGYAWDTDEQTRLAYFQAKERFAVEFEHADYLVDLFVEDGDDIDNIDTFR